MKICFIADTESIHIIEWAKHFHDIGFDVSVITDSSEPIDNIKTYHTGECLPRFYIPVLNALFQIFQKVKKIRNFLIDIKPDIIHAHYATNNGFLAALSGFHPLILTCHGSDILVDLKKSISESIFIKYALIKSDLITVPSEPMAEIIRSYVRPESRVKIIQYGIDTDRFTFPSKNEYPIRIISSRLLIPKYRIDVLIDAALSFLTKNDKIILDILGNGIERKVFQKITAENKLNKQIIFHGNVEHTHIHRYYQDAHIYVTTSPTDGVSISLLEAMACGCYPVLPDNSSNRYIEKLGFKIVFYKTNNPKELANKISQVLSKLPDLSSDLLLNRTLIERHFSKRVTFRKIEKLYNEIIP